MSTVRKVDPHEERFGVRPFGSGSPKIAKEPH